MREQVEAGFRWKAAQSTTASTTEPAARGRGREPRQPETAKDTRRSRSAKPKAKPTKKRTRANSEPPGGGGPGDGNGDDGEDNQWDNWWHTEGEYNTEDWDFGDDDPEDPNDDDDDWDEEEEEEEEDVPEDDSSDESEPKRDKAREKAIKIARDAKTEFPFFREPEKIVFRQQPSAPEQRLWWIHARHEVARMVPDPKIIREWTLKIKLATKQKSLRDPGPFPSIDAKIRTSMIAIMNGELRSNVLEKDGRGRKDE
jgi:hypothetical protein